MGIILTLKILYLLFIMHRDLVYVSVSVTISKFNLYHPNHNRRELVLQQHKMDNFFLVFKYNLSCLDFLLSLLRGQLRLPLMVFIFQESK